MPSDSYWYILAALFGVVGLIHLLRALKSTGNKRNTRLAMGGASLIWGATALTLRFVGIYPAGLVALAAVGCMLLAAVTSGKVR